MLQLLQKVALVNEWVGRTVSWLLLAMMLLTCVVVVVRYVFNLGSIALQEAVLYLHGCVFMLALAYTLHHRGHVRVDVLSQHFSPTVRAGIEIAGTLLFLVPFALFILVTSLDYVAFSWRLLEGSAQPGGLPGVFLVKSLIPLSAALLLLQAVAELARDIQRLMGDRTSA